MYMAAALAAVSDTLSYMNSRITEVVGYIQLISFLCPTTNFYATSSRMQKSQALLLKIQQQFVGNVQLGAPGRVSHAQVSS